MRNVRLHKEIQRDPLYRAPWRTDEQLFLFREEMEAARRRPSLAAVAQDNAFDVLISLGGDEKTSSLIQETFGQVGPRFFDGFITPFHALIKLFETNFRDLFSTTCLYGYHEALRCRDTLLIYHNCLKLAEGESASVEIFRAQHERMKQEYNALLQEIDKICRGKSRVLFVRDWRETLHYEGSHRPLHSVAPDFKRLANAIAQRYPGLDFKILFTNYGDACVDDPRLIFFNLRTPDVCDDLKKLNAWKDMAMHLGLYIKNENMWNN
ncbi:hypothetical protein GT348_01065 [Aristophania vespae]|uniref:Uncharacterized protein n=1 Tax=Aristophania vespae TaxID=2697033 RepID=A0A6P1NDS0_9PROT|nr:hypothetical protein [Aristophania vespae]QHI95077.1 hypothetical protein GT348_01065 [Aristophania vespae]